ncbi:MAG: exodeoxyribonuclease V subunit beta [Desulfuromonadales bacterium]|nr:exodeoxyribonuclease V subunit beta [Desulfuromonadales bacterium]
MKNLNLATIETSGQHLIEASAGTGKTWTIAALYILLLLENRLRPEEILVVTYTKAATAELRDRIRQRISQTLELYSSGRTAGDDLEQILLTARITDSATAVKLLTRALYSFDDAAIFTIHGFCQRALSDNAFESGSLFDTGMVSDQSGIVREACDDYWRSRILGQPDEFLEQLIAARCTPDSLAKPFRGQYQNPDLTIIPATGDPDLAPLTARRDTLFPQLKTLWLAERETILNLLAAANLSQTSYKPAQIHKAAGALDNWFSAGDGKQGCPGLKLFTRDALLKGQKKGSTLLSHPLFDLCQEMHDTMLLIDEAFRAKLIHHQTALHSWLKTELTRRKRSQNLRCFDDLLLDLHQALAGSGGDQLAQSLGGHYRAALIDEFQDTDQLQWQIFARLAGLDTGEASYPLFLIGDPKQAIYSFRGADIFAYIAASRAIDNARKCTLDTNRRSTEPLVAAVNRLFQSADDPFLCRDIAFKPVKSGREPEQNLLRNGQPLEQPLQLWVHPRDDQSTLVRKGEACRTVVRCVAEEIARLLDGTVEIIDRKGRRSLKPGDIAVLVKAHYQADLVQGALVELGIPSVQHGSATIFESAEALDLLRILRAVHEPSRERLLREALLTASMGLSANDVAGYLGEAANDTAWEEWLRRFRDLNGAARTGGVISLAERLLGECGVRRRALSRAGGERTLTNILHCVELLHQAEQERACGLEGLIIWLERHIVGNVEDETALLRLETDADAVQLSTIHASKGLEYPVVFLPFAWDSPSARTDQVIFHDDDNRLTLDLGSDSLEANKAIARSERAAEAARLLYVSVTRAEFLCYLAWGCISDAHNSPLFPLLHGRTIEDPKQFKSCSDASILEDIRLLGTPDSGLAADFMPVDAPAPPYRPQQENQGAFTCRSLKQPIASDWRVSSFSSLAAGSERSLQPRDYDALTFTAAESAPDETAVRPAGNSIFDFPRGSSAGTCLHEILERLDFAALTDAQIEQVSGSRLRANGYGDEWLAAVGSMVASVTQAWLIGEDQQFNLSQLKKGAWQTELEFFLPVALLSPEYLRQAFDGLLKPSLHGNYQELLDALTFQQSRGMLHGFIDLVFEHTGRYYILDWKSNHLGFSETDYSRDNMTRSMADHSYILQYHLYSLALHRHLTRRLPGYSYETHFGGAIYVYLRGVNAENPVQGIYRDKPPTEFIDRANRLLLA